MTNIEDAVGIITKIFETIFDRTELFPHSDFYDLGGDSLSTMMLHLALDENFGFGLEAIDLRSHPTVAEIAALCAAQCGRQSKGNEPVSREMPTGSDPQRLSRVQRRMYDFDVTASESLRSITEVYYQLPDDIDASRMQAALIAVVDQNPILRAHFRQQGADPVQAIDTVDIPTLQEIDLGAGPPGDWRHGAIEFFRAWRMAPFDLATPFLFRVALVRTAGGPVLLGICVHHIISDASSVRMLATRLMAAYHALERGRAIEGGPRFGRHYWDFAAWEAALSDEAALPAKRYWSQALAGVDFVNPLGLRRRMPEGPTMIDGSVRFDTQQGAMLRLRQAADQRRILPNGIAIAAMAIAVARCFGTRDVAAAMLLNARDIIGMDGVIGPILARAYFRLRVPHHGFADTLCEAASQAALSAMLHPILSIRQDAEQAQPHLGMQGRFPLLNWIPEPHLEMSSGQAVPFTVPEATSMGPCAFMLVLYAGERDLRMRIDYPSILFDEIEIERLGSDFLQALEECLAPPKRTTAMASASEPLPVTAN